jgi:hypothetical protein
MERALLAGAALAAAFCLQLDEAQAQPRSASGSCRTMSEVYGPADIWWGRFAGGKPPVRIGRPAESRAFEVCFHAQRDCETWLANLKAEYSYRPEWYECQQGYAPEGRAAPWWRKTPRG